MRALLRTKARNLLVGVGNLTPQGVGCGGLSSQPEGCVTAISTEHSWTGAQAFRSQSGAKLNFIQSESLSKGKNKKFHRKFEEETKQKSKTKLKSVVFFRCFDDSHQCKLEVMQRRTVTFLDIVNFVLFRPF